MNANLTVPIGARGKVRELRGVKSFPTAAAGLVVHRRADATVTKRTPWVVTHLGSQLALPGKFTTRAAALAAVELVTDLNWTVDGRIIERGGMGRGSYGSRWMGAMCLHYNGSC